jgi:hypothetical protein
MNSLTPLGSRAYQTIPTAQQPDSRQARSNPVKTAGASDAVSLSSRALDMQKRVADLGNSTVDRAQNLLGSFAQSLFGDDAKGASFSFDSITLESSSSFAAGVMHAEGPNGTSDAAVLSLSDSSHFLGKGTITMADGRKFDFEVEIQYEASLQAGAASSVPSRRQELADQNPAMPLPTVEFPDIDFPGSLADLFKLMERNYEISVKQKRNEGKDDELGKLSMHLLKLVNSESQMDTYLPSKAKDVANAYGAKSLAPKADAPAIAAPEAAPAPEVQAPAPDAQASAPAATPAASAAPSTAAVPADAGQKPAE